MADIEFFETYERFCVYKNGEETNEYIRLFEVDDSSAANLINSRFARKLVLPKKVIDYEKLYRALGFSESAILNDKVRLSGSDGYTIRYTDGENIKRTHYDELEQHKYCVQTKCVAVKMECLWENQDVYCYPDRDLVDKHIPDISKYSFALVNNTMLSKAEIPFLIFDRNKGRCFIERN